MVYTPTLCKVTHLLIFGLYRCQRLNHVKLCISYTATLSLMSEISTMHTVPLAKWIADGEVIKFWGDNACRQETETTRCTVRPSWINGTHVQCSRWQKSHTSSTALSLRACITCVKHHPCHDLAYCRGYLSSEVQLGCACRVLTQYLSGLAPFSKAVTKHITHQYTAEMSRKSEVVVLDVLLKNETVKVHADMILILSLENVIRVPWYRL